MRHRAFLLAHVQTGFVLLLRFSDPLPFLLPFFGNRASEFAQNLPVNLWPELQKRHRGIEADIEGSVVGVIEAFQESKRCWVFTIGSCRTSPESASIGQHVEFVEEHASIPKRLALIINIRSLPGIDSVAPRCGVLQPVTGDGPGVGAVDAIKVGVAAIPLAPLTE